MTQEQIGDATGLTAVHVNRMLRQLEEEGVFERNGRNVRISDWAQMKRVAEFDDGYLHLAA
jgi:DNA-binding Lrp family transcriptional regulator